MRTPFSDHFSRQSDVYAKYRPGYPTELFKYLEHLTSANAAVWDCATGNGQAAVALSGFAGHVFATDASRSQIFQSQPANNISYLVATAEHTPFSDQCFDLITIAQALHWFDFNEFFKEAKRVLKPGAVLAAWTYGLPRINEKVDALIDYFYEHILGDYWPLERRFVDEYYASIFFPLKEIKPPKFVMEANWTGLDFIGFLNTWSATQKYIERKDSNPIDLIADKIYSVWPKTKNEIIRWPMYMRIGHF